MKNPQYYFLLLFLFIFPFLPAKAVERIYNVLFIQSYTSRTAWHEDLNKGIIKGFRDEGLKVDVTTEYLDADFWTFPAEKVIMRRICQRARERKTDLIITVSDEAFYTLFSCGDSLPFQLPVVFYGIKYPDKKLIDKHPNVCGYTSNPDFDIILQQAQKIFPQRKEVVCVIDNSFLSNKGVEDFKNEWEEFSKKNPDYRMKVYNTQNETTNHIIAAVCYPRNSFGRVVIAPKWSPFLSFIGKNSKAPVFASYNAGPRNGVLAAYDADPFAASVKAAKKASMVLKGKSPKDLGVEESEQGFIYDYTQLDFFHINPDVVTSSGVIMNMPYWDQYRWWYILFFSSILALLVLAIFGLVRANRREVRRRVHAQTRLLVQNRLVEQRNEFDNVFHSIRDGVITYDVDFHIHFTNRSLLRMLHLPEDENLRPYEGLMAGSIFKIYLDGKDILFDMLKEVVRTEKRVVIPEGAFMKEVHSDNYFPVSGEIVPIRSREEMTGMALSARNISDEEMQKRFFNLAVEESSIYPWQFNLASGNFIFPQGFLTRFGYDEKCTTISREEMDKMIDPEDVAIAQSMFDKALMGENSRINFRQKNIQGEYEWWEYRASVLKGMTTDSPYSILGVCQSIQRYKRTEQELREARDKALQADKLKSAFLANMSHEIRTPLNAIVGFSDLLSDTSGFTEQEVAQFVGTINKNCSLLLALINDILDLSRIESGTMDFQFASHNLSLLLKTVYDSQRLNMPAGVQLVLRMPQDEKKYLMTDNVRLQQVVNNLINNAAKFTTSGSITFGYEEEEPGYTLLFVEDTGVGISEEGLKHIFERFYKVDSFTQGAGLGLSICQTIVERLKGTISVSSQIGVGTRFTVRIPDECE